MSIAYNKVWVLYLSGADAAVARAREGLDKGVPDASIIESLVEAVWWVTAADETLEAEYGAAWTHNLRPALFGLKTIVGLRWVGNRIAHQVCHWELAKAPFNWGGASTLAPPGAAAGHHDHGRAEYESELEGNPALDAFGDVVPEIRNAAASGLA